MPKIVLYGNPFSPPVRALEMTLRALELEYKFELVDFLKRDHHSPEYLKRNPLHSIPTLVIDDDLVLVDSHAIMVYLVCKYGKPNDPLFPDDLVTRAKINQYLFFETGVLFCRIRNISEPVFLGATSTPQERVDYVNKGLQLLEVALQDKDSYLVGDAMTLADLSCVSSVATVEATFPGTLTNYPSISAWVGRLSSLPYYAEVNQKGAEYGAGLYRKMLELNKARAS